MIRNVRGKFDTAALRIDESQAESSARLFERARVLDDPHTRLLQLRCRANHSIFAVQGISDVMQSASVAAMKAEDEALRRGASKEDRVAIGFYLLKALDIGIERGVILDVRREKSDMPDLSDFQRHTIAVPYGRFKPQLGGT